MIGDGENDIKAGLAARCKSILVNGNGTDTKNEDFGQIDANHRESGPYQFDEFLNKYETIFEYPDENNAIAEVRKYIDDLSAIVNQYI